MGQSKVGSLLVERCLAVRGRCEYHLLLSSAHGLDTLVLKFIISRFTLYRALYERLETIGCTMEASKCFRQMVHELVEDVPDEQSEWVFGEWSCIRCMYR